MTDTNVRLPNPERGRAASEEFVAHHLSGLFEGEPVGSERFRGGQSSADAALEAFDVARYANRRNEVLPTDRRGASALSPYIRHGLLQLPQVWSHVAGGPEYDVRKFRDELMWQEFARHWYARLGDRTASGIRRDQVAPTEPDRSTAGTGIEGWDRSMRCLDENVTELERDGWLVNQTRMWLSSEWAVRHGQRWQAGEDVFFRHLLDGSRAANRLGWQWTTGVGSAKHYGFSRWQVEKRAKGLCSGCDHRDDCPIGDWPQDPMFVSVERPDAVRRGDEDSLNGPQVVERSGEPEAVWLTAESLGVDDPALVANPGLAAIFVFDRGLLAKLKLSAKRLVFLCETLAELAAEREVHLWLGAPGEVLANQRSAVTHAPVPGFARVHALVKPVEVHPWPWLCAPAVGSVASFSAWRKSVGRPM
ncbi:MAG: FAD-binding domain-containing protein [Ilumatobacter sp.]